MKLFNKVMLAALVLALLLPFAVLKNDEGKPLMSFSSFSLPEFSLPEMPSLPASSAPVEAQGIDLGGRDVIYQWRDAHGNLNFTSEPPPEGVEFTLRGFDPDANVIPSLSPAAIEGDDGGEATAQTKAQPREPGDIGNPYSREAIEKLFEDAKNIEKMLNERLQQ